MKPIEEIWPQFGLRIRSGPLELAERGIHDPQSMPFLYPWTDAPATDLARNMAVYYWTARAANCAEHWSLEMVVRHKKQIVGIQAFDTANFLVTRTGETGSWLGLEHQGRGIGTLMRQTMCAFVFDHLDAEEVTSGAFLDNPASAAVSSKVGYTPNGRTRRKRRQSEVAVCQQLVLRPADLVRSAYPVEVEGLAEFRRDIGLPVTDAG
jgi:RimJ/RimL family protein N-acetyltransferase